VAQKDLLGLRGKGRGWLQEPPGGFGEVGQLIFVGLNGYVVALDRDTGAVVWSCSELKSGYISLLLDGDRLIVSTAQAVERPPRRAPQPCM
jgi:hypothetical protein